MLSFSVAPSKLGNIAETDESRDVQWASVDEVRALMAPAYAIRVADALLENLTSVRTHDGVNVHT